MIQVECRKGISEGVGEGVVNGLKVVGATGVGDSVGSWVIKTCCGVVGLWGVMGLEGLQGSKSGSGVSRGMLEELDYEGRLKGKTIS